MPGGKILASGGPGFSGGGFLFARYNGNGLLDTTFDRDRKLSLAIAGGRLLAAATDGQNRIVAVGANGDALNNGSFVTARIAVNGSVPFDHDGDGRADHSVLRPSNSTWYIQSTVAYRIQQWGAEGDKLAPADYDGDGRSDLAAFRPSDGTWRILLSETQTLEMFTFGQDGDIPVSADRNADGRAEPVLFRPGTNQWLTRFSSTSTSTDAFGAAGDKPLTGDFDADGRSDLAVYRPSDHNWYLQRTIAGFMVMTWGEDSEFRFRPITTATVRRTSPFGGRRPGDGTSSAVRWDG